METKLPVLLIGAFLLGALPFWVMARATRWRMKRKLESTERALMAATGVPSSPSPSAADNPAAPSLSSSGPA